MKILIYFTLFYFINTKYLVNLVSGIKYSILITTILVID